MEKDNFFLEFSCTSVLPVLMTDIVLNKIKRRTFTFSVRHNLRIEILAIAFSIMVNYYHSNLDFSSFTSELVCFTFQPHPL